MCAERRASQAWDARLLAQPAAAAAGAPPHDGLLGRLEIPRLGLSAAVREGVGDETLDVAVGHVPGTARPGSPGNVALAGHRDAEFRPLRELRVGDEIVLSSPDGAERYRVEWMRVLPPDRVDVLRSTAREAALTLVTCYPFDFVGRAPKRFVVRAARI